MNGGATNIAFIFFAGLSSLLVAIPLPKALASGNVGTSMVILWTEAGCLVQLINAALWHDNIKNWAPAWCDFCGYFLIATDIGIAASGLCITRRIYLIVTFDPRRHLKVFDMLVDLFLCFVMPWVFSSLGYVVQQYRFYIYEGVGCLPGIANVDLAFPLVWMIPLVVGTVSTGYAYLTIRENLRRNNTFTGELGRNSTWSRRLVALGVVSAMYGLIPTMIAMALLATAYPVIPWPGWGALHSTIDDVVFVTMEQWQSRTIEVASTELRRWTIVSLAFVVFFFLGLTEEVRRMYWPPFKSSVVQSLSFDQRGTRTSVLELSVGDQIRNDSRSSKYRRSGFVPLGEAVTGWERQNSGLIDKPYSDFEGECFELVIPTSPPPAATRSTYQTWPRGRGDVAHTI